MIKILNIIGKRPTGGIGSFTYNYQSHFNCEDLKIDYLLFDDESKGSFDEKVKSIGSTVYILPALKNIRLISLWIKINKFMKEIGKNYDIIHLHSVNIAFMCFPSAKKYGVKHLISHSHATVYSDKILNAIRNKILCRNLLKQANVYMACSIAAGEFLYGKQNMNKVVILNNAIECEKFKFSNKIQKEYRKRFNLENKFIIGNIGRFCEQKNQTFLIDIFLEYQKKNKNAELVLVGDGPTKKDVELKVRELGLSEKVHFLGIRNDIEKILQMFDIFVLPSLFEGLPVIGIEAQASGLPMVVSDTVTRELDLGNVSFISLNEKPEKWADAIIKCKINEERAVAFKKVMDLGYEINIEAKKLKEHYFRLIKNNLDKN